MSKISIIVPVYNVEQYLDECVKSLVNQTFDDYEIILVDDGSTDSSGKMCDAYAHEYSNVRVIHQANGGLSRARNAGIRNATGKYIMYVDSDDYIKSNACEVFFAAAEKNNADIVWADMDYINDPTQENKAKCLQCLNSIVSGPEYLRQSLDAGGVYDIVSFLKMVKREFIIKNDLYFIEGYFYEDQEYTLKLLLVPDSRLLRIDFPFYYYRQRPGSITMVHDLKKGTDFIKVIHAMIDLVNTTYLAPEIRAYAENAVAIAVYHLSAVYVHMAGADRKSVRKLIDKTIRQYALKTKHLSLRMKIQNRMFIYCPLLLVWVFFLKG